MSIHDGTSREPVDREAAMLLTKGESFEFEPNNRVFSIQPNLNPVPSNITDYTGKSWFRFKVIGYSHSESRVAGNRERKRCYTQWVVQCQCGRYEYRSQDRIRAAIKRIRQGKHIMFWDKMCGICKQLDIHKQENT